MIVQELLRNDLETDELSHTSDLSYMDDELDEDSVDTSESSSIDDFDPIQIGLLQDLLNNAELIVESDELSYTTNSSPTNIADSSVEQTVAISNLLNVAVPQVVRLTDFQVIDVAMIVLGQAVAQQVPNPAATPQVLVQQHPDPAAAPQVIAQEVPAQAAAPQVLAQHNPAQVAAPQVFAQQDPAQVAAPQVLAQEVPAQAAAPQVLAQHNHAQVAAPQVLAQQVHDPAAAAQVLAQRVNLQAGFRQAAVPQFFAPQVIAQPAVQAPQLVRPSILPPYGFPGVFKGIYYSNGAPIFDGPRKGTFYVNGRNRVYLKPAQIAAIQAGAQAPAVVPRAVQQMLLRPQQIAVHAMVPPYGYRDTFNGN